jgi:hypothetical protein
MSVKQTSVCPQGSDKELTMPKMEQIFTLELSNHPG